MLSISSFSTKHQLMNTTAATTHHHHHVAHHRHRQSKHRSTAGAAQDFQERISVQNIFIINARVGHSGNERHLEHGQLPQKAPRH